MKKIYLHMGFPKTASTSFQTTCMTNINRLEEQGFAYPLPEDLDGFRFYERQNHNIMMWALFYPNRYFIPLQCSGNFNICREYYKPFIQNILATKKNIILSAEDFLYVTNKNNIKEIISFFTQYGHEIIPIAFIRSPYEFACSFQQQMIKVGLSPEIINYMSQIEVIENMKNFFPNTRSFPFKSVCQHPQGPVGFLFDQIGIDYSDFEFVITNEGTSNTTTRIQQALNIHEPRIAHKQANLHFASIEHLDSTAFPQKFLFTKKEFEPLQEAYGKEDAYFREHLGEEFCDKEIKFSEEDPVSKLCIEVLQCTDKWSIKTIQPTLNLCGTRHYLKIFYFWYKMLSKITSGKTRKQYREKRGLLSDVIKILS